MDDDALLTRYLAATRAHVLAAVDGLDDAALTTSVVRTGWTPAGMVQHLALDVERFWFVRCFAGEEVDDSLDPESAWAVEPGGGAAALARYRAECGRADAAIAGHSLDEPPAWWPDFFGSWRLHSLGELLMHVVVETATHAGHLDIARETIDGTQHLVLG